MIIIAVATLGVFSALYLIDVHSGEQQMMPTLQGATDTINNGLNMATEGSHQEINTTVVPQGSTTTEVAGTATPVIATPKKILPLKVPSTAAKNYTIKMSDYLFQPKTLTIKKGDTVTWINNDLASHTVTTDTGPELASDYLKNGESFSHTFTTVGNFSYHCEPHPYMKAIIIVQ